ncbi:MAG: hypothetical protein NC399_09220 [Muribaculum sp.]|nr:hypothetical protein [Muribaculum sp.]
MKKKFLLLLGIGLCVLCAVIVMMTRPAAQHTNINEEGMAGSVKTGESANIDNDTAFIE